MNSASGRFSKLTAKHDSLYYTPKSLAVMRFISVAYTVLLFKLVF